MKKLKNLFLMTALLAIVFTSCQEDVVDVNPSGEKVTTSVHGIVVDESGEVIQGVAIKIDGNTSATDKYGNFVFTSISIPSDNAFLTASKSGYFNGSRTFQPVKNSVNKIKIMLMDKGTAKIVDGSSGGEADLGNGTKVTFPANGIKKADGSIYNGMVSVYAKKLDPIDPSLPAMMPGDLIAENTGGEEQALETFGMIVVELEGSSGEALNVADGSTAEITLQLDAAVANGAPATIPLWYFDEVSGLWKEEGTATLVGNKYVGNVSHFSFWNCDAPFPIVKITGTIVDGTTPLANVLVKVSRTNGSTNRPSGYGFTDSAGVFCGKMPANENLLLEVLNLCNEVVSDIPIGPFATDQNIGSITADVSTNTTEIVGSAVDCDNNVIGNVYVEVKFGTNKEYYYGSGASFSIPIIYCTGITEVEIRVIDIDEEKESGWLTFPLSPTTTDVGNVIACDGIGEYISFTIDGNESFIFQNLGAYLEGDFYHGVGGNNGSGNESINYNLFNPDSTSTFGVGTYIISGNGLNQDYFSASDGTNFYIGDSIILTYTSFGDVGELIEGTFTGTVNDSTTTENISGIVHVLRDN